MLTCLNRLVWCVSMCGWFMFTEHLLPNYQDYKMKKLTSNLFYFTSSFSIPYLIFTSTLHQIKIYPHVQIHTHNYRCIMYAFIINFCMRNSICNSICSKYHINFHHKKFISSILVSKPSAEEIKETIII